MAFSAHLLLFYCPCLGCSAGGAGASSDGADSVPGVGAGAVPGAGIVTGAGAVSVTGGGALCVIVEPCPPFAEMYARLSDVSMNTAAETVVRRDKKVAGPRLPKKVCDEP